MHCSECNSERSSSKRADAEPIRSPALLWALRRTARATPGVAVVAEAVVVEAMVAVSVALVGVVVRAVTGALARGPGWEGAEGRPAR